LPGNSYGDKRAAYSLIKRCTDMCYRSLIKEWSLQAIMLKQWRYIMPIFEYHCDKCNHNFESIVFGKEKPVCPSCKSKKARKLMSTCGFVSKGSGGETVRASSSSSSCGGCSAASCAGCGH
jgi:putative FmdB family regulatory protein